MVEHRILVGLAAVAVLLGAAPISAESAVDVVPLEAVDGDALPMDDLYEEDIPHITVGKAVDLLGADIEPAGKALAPGLAMGGMPSGSPLNGGRLTSGFGMRYHPVLGGYRFHSGIDIAAATGTPVAATSAGRVTAAGWSGGYGVLVAIAHGGSVETRYGHLSAVAVRAGDSVQRGQIIGYVGSTGRSTGPHLHYETRIAGRAADPRRSW